MVEGASDSFTSWAAGRRPGLVRAAYLLTADQGRAEDLVQEALLKVAMRWNRLQAGNPDAYVRTVLYRDFVSWWRRKRDVTLEHPSDSSTRVYESEAVDRTVLMETALSRLTRKQRAVLVLRYYEDMSEQQTADLLGVSPGTVKSQSFHALSRLRENAPEIATLRGAREATNDG